MIEDLKNWIVYDIEKKKPLYSSDSKIDAEDTSLEFREYTDIIHKTEYKFLLKSE